MRPNLPRLAACALLIVSGAFVRSAEGQIATRLDGIAALDQAILSFTVAPVVGLAPITLSELVDPAVTTVDRGAYGIGTDVAGGVIVNGTISRDANALWTACAKQKDINDLQIDYAIVAANGDPDALSSVLDPTNAISVAITPLKPVKLGNCAPGGHKFFQGGITLTLGIGNVKVAGTYSGTLTITINNL